MTTSVTDETETLALLDPAQREDWRALQLRKKTLKCTGCPTPEHITRLKGFKTDWKKFLNSLDPNHKKQVQAYEKRMAKAARAKAKAKSKKQPKPPKHKRKKFNGNIETQIPQGQLRRFLRARFFDDNANNIDTTRSELLLRTRTSLDGKTLLFADALASNSRRWVHKIAKELGLYSQSRPDPVTGKRIVTVSATSLTSSSRDGVPATHTAFSWATAAAVPATHTGFSWHAGAARAPKASTSAAAAAASAASAAAGMRDLVDVDANLLHEALADHLQKHIQVARLQGVRRMVVPGVTLAQSVACQQLAATYPGTCFATAGVHPYHAQAPDSCLTDSNLALLRQLAAAEGCRCVGECGLDASEGFPPLGSQLPWFKAQVAAACDLAKPLFLHERKAHRLFVDTLDSFKPRLPPVLVHCFTGTGEELAAYVARGYYVGITGFICGSGRGPNELRRVLPAVLPLNRLMVETDSPYLGFKNCRNLPNGDGGYHYAQRKKKFPNVPSALPLVVAALAKCYGVSCDEIARATTYNACQFFNL